MTDHLPSFNTHEEIIDLRAEVAEMEKLLKECWTRWTTPHHATVSIQALFGDDTASFAVDRSLAATIITALIQDRRKRIESLQVRLAAELAAQAAKTLIADDLPAGLLASTVPMPTKTPDGTRP